MSYDYTKLLQPITINGMRLKNRISMSPMGTFTPNQDGTEREEGIAYYEARAKGGVGLIQTGAMFLTSALAQGSPTIALDNHLTIPRSTVLVERCHRWGAKVCLQVSPGTGRNTTLGDMYSDVPVSASEVPAFYDPSVICRALTTEEIKGIMENWKVAATYALRSGFDAIEVHAHAGYLIDQFLSPEWNHRTDEYGGSFENRCRFAAEIVEAIRSVVGPKFPILFRISLDHRMNGGRSLQDSMPILEILEKAGVDAFDIDAGCYESMDYIFPTCYVGESCMSYVCKEARKHVHVPILNAGSHSMETAVELLESGDADIIQFGRQCIADPEFPNKLKAGHREDIRPCLICNEECIGRIFGRLTQLSCAVNPSTGFEESMVVTPLPQPKKVVVIGGGPGGMEAARMAAIRGCRVTLYEASNHLGGTFGAIATAPFKKRIRDLVAWYGVQLEKLGVEVVLNRAVSANDPCLAVADEIFVATGSVPVTPKIPGLDNPKVIDVVDAHRKGVTGESVAICGGGLSGCDSALELAMEGKKVTIIEMMDSCARDVMYINKISLDRMLKEYKVEILCGSKVVGIGDDGVSIETCRGDHKTVQADTIITAFGQRPNNAVSNAIAERYPLKTTLIGDCEKVGKAGSAIRAGFYAAMALQ